MRSLIAFAVLIAAIGFTGCQGTGGGSARGLLAGGNLNRHASCGCGATAVEAGDCGCGGEVYSDPGTIEHGPADGGCGCGCDAPVSYSAPHEGGAGCTQCGTPTVAPMEFSAPASGGECKACNAGASYQPRRARNLFKGIGATAGDGMGLSKNDPGMVCRDDAPSAPSRIAERRTARSLKPRGTRASLKNKYGFAKTEATIVSSEEVDLVSDEYIVGCDDCASGVGGRRISHGVISDIREARGARIGGAVGCGHRGCGHSGRLQHAGGKIRNLAGIGSGNPYGGAIPHTAQAPGQSGLAPSYAYPYYTTRGPRDFLRDNPPSIGR